MPGPESSKRRRTSWEDSCSMDTRTVPVAGDHLAALSMRLSVARPNAKGSPSSSHGIKRTKNSTSGRRRRARSSEAIMTSQRSTGSASRSLPSSRAKSTRSPIKVESSFIWDMTSSSRSLRSSSLMPKPPPARLSIIKSSILVRIEVSGVFNSCPASATN